MRYLWRGICGVAERFARPLLSATVKFGGGCTPADLGLVQPHMAVTISF